MSMVKSYFELEKEMLFEILRTPNLNNQDPILQAAQTARINQITGTNKDNSGYYPNVDINTCGVKTINMDEIKKFNSYKGRLQKGTNLTSTEIKSLISKIRQSITGGFTYSNSPNNSIYTRGLCSRGIINASYLLNNSLKNHSPEIVWGNRPKKEGNSVVGSVLTSNSGVGSSINAANNRPLHDSYFGTTLGYTKHIIAQNLPLNDVKNTIKQLSWEDGDICIYWSNSPGNGNLSKYKYGHIQMYHFKDISTPRWFSDVNHGEFVYSSGECWTIIALKAS